MIRVSWFLTNEQVEKIKELCQKSELTQSEILRRCIDFYVNKELKKYKKKDKEINSKK